MAKPIRLPGRTLNGNQNQGTRSASGQDSADADYLQVVHLLSEGEIDGLIDDGSDGNAALKSIYLNGTPIRNQDGTYNFKDIAWAQNTGTAGQTSLPGFSSAESPTAVGQNVLKATPVVRQITGAFDRVVVTLEAEGFYKYDLNSDGKTDDDHSGDMIENWCQMLVEVQPSGGTYSGQNMYFYGKYTQAKTQSVSLPLTGSSPWNVRVTRVSADDTDPTKASSTIAWKTLTTVVDGDFSYPNSAYVALEVPSTSMANPPAVSFKARGRKIQIPSNYDPTARTYTGTWDGTFSTAYSNNPAWVMYDLLTNSRYGLGDLIDASAIDKWGLYSIGQYCDQLVDDGKGGQEPRFTCNLYLQSQQEAYQVVQSMAAIFRAMPYWASGALAMTQDAPGDPQALFTCANVVDGTFTYSSSAKRSRHTVAIVSWNDPNNHCQATKEYVEDAAGKALYGYQPLTLGAWGCTSQGQAARAGRWALFTERLETETVTFQAGLDAALLPPGAIITIQDQFRAGNRQGGRIKAATTETLTLDSAVTLESGKTYSVQVVLPDGTLGNATVSNAAGQTDTLTLSVPLSAAPLVDAVWVLAASDDTQKEYRILSVTESGPNQYTVSALLHYGAKYDSIESGLSLTGPGTVTAATGLAPTGLVVSEQLYQARTGLKVRLLANWDQTTDADGYVLRWRPWAGTWNNPETITTHSWTREDVTPGKYEVEVRARIYGQLTDASSVVYAVLGKSAPPADVTGFAVVDHPLSVDLTWDPVPDLDLDCYELRQGSDWASSTLISQLKGTAYTWNKPAAVGSYAFRIKARDTSGNYSTNEATVSASVVLGTIGSDWIGTGAVGPGNIADNAIENRHISAGAVKNGSIYPGDLTGDRFQDGTIGTAQLGSGAVTGDKIAQGTITQGNFDPGTIIDSTPFSPGAFDNPATFGPGVITYAAMDVGAVHGDTVADGAIATRHLLTPPADNLVPNGYGEAGAAAIGLTPEGVGLVNDPANAFEGDWCRKQTYSSDSASRALAFTGYIPCSEGDQFVASVMAKASEAGIGGFLYILGYDSAGNIVNSADYVDVGNKVTTTYAKFTVKSTVPSGVVSVRLYHDNGSYVADSGQSTYFDAIQMRRALIAPVIETDNYTEDANGNPTAGFKADSSGTAAKVAPDGMQVGQYTLSDSFFRALQGLDGTWAHGIAFYRGNCDPDTNGGAPNIACLRVDLTGLYFQANSSQYYTVINIRLAPIDIASDNIDAMRYAEVSTYNGRAGVTVNPAPFYGLHWPLVDRCYRYAGSNPNNNADYSQFNYVTVLSALPYDNGSSNYCVLKISIHNAYGQSAERWFLPPAASAGSYTQTATYPFSTGGESPPTLGGGGGGGGIGSCPAPWEPVLMANQGRTGPGLYVPAGQIKVGDYVWTQHETTGAWGAYRVSAVSLESNLRAKLKLTDGRELTLAANHRLRIPGGWRALNRIQPGTMIAGAEPGFVASTRPVDAGPVVRLSIEDAKTYVHSGIVGHNAKPIV